uniref:Oxidoreductase-like domain-containing protein n=1 Tax=Anopheles christyi TaxID=43041 RepID=A0A182K3B7_9DIPT
MVLAAMVLRWKSTIHTASCECTGHIVPAIVPAAQFVGSVRTDGKRRCHSDERAGKVKVPGDGGQVALRFRYHHHLDRGPAETAGQCVLVRGEHLAEEVFALRLIVLPPEPTTCCMSGCQNCVWIQYAADLTKILDDGGEKARAIVLEKISDPSLKMFLKMELQNMPPSKSDPT